MNANIRRLVKGKPLFRTWETALLTAVRTNLAPAVWSALPQPYPTNETGDVILEIGPERQKFYRLHHP